MGQGSEVRQYVKVTGNDAGQGTFILRLTFLAPSLPALESQLHPRIVLSQNFDSLGDSNMPWTDQSLEGCNTQPNSIWTVLISEH